MNITANIEAIRKTIGPNVKLIAVSKTRSVNDIEAVIQAGICIIGENRIQEAKTKFSHLTLPVEKHLIGHLQTNKVRDAVQLFDLIQSVDSLRLAQKINTEAEKQNKIMPILLQVNIASDSNKHGFSTSEISDALKTVSRHKNLTLRGLMAIVPYEENPERTRPHFRALKTLFEQLKETYPTLAELSMGMSNDYRIAAEEGATMVRIGRGVFDEGPV